MISITTIEDSIKNPKSEWYKPYTDFPRPREIFLKLPEKYSFDVEKMREEIEKIQQYYEFKPFPVSIDGKKRRRQYRGIGLTCRPNSIDKIYDNVDNFFQSEEELQDAKSYFDHQGNATIYEDCFSEKNELWSGYLGEVLNRFKSETTKVRLLCMKSKGILPSHVDFPHYQQIKVHSYITTNDNVWVDVEGNRYSIPSDGNFYWFDIGRWHAAWNDGDTDRIDLCVNLKLYYDRNGNSICDSSIDVVDLIQQGKL